MKIFITIISTVDIGVFSSSVIDEGRVADLRVDSPKPCLRSWSHVGVVPRDAWLQPLFLAKSPMACLAARTYGTKGTQMH